MKSGNLNFLEASGPLRACNGSTLLYIFSLFCWVSGHWTPVWPDCSRHHEAIKK